MDPDPKQDPYPDWDFWLDEYGDWDCRWLRFLMNMDPKHWIWVSGAKLEITSVLDPHKFHANPDPKGVKIKEEN